MRCWRGLGVGLAAVACPGDATDQVNGFALSLLLLIVEEAVSGLCPVDRADQGGTPAYRQTKGAGSMTPAQLILATPASGVSPPMTSGSKARTSPIAESRSTTSRFLRPQLRHR